MIPLSTTTISVLHMADADLDEEPYSGTDERAVTATAVRAVIDHPTGAIDVEGGVQAVSQYGLKCDLVTLDYRDHIRDDTTGQEFTITWYLTWPEHVEAGLRDVRGEV